MEAWRKRRQPVSRSTKPKRFAVQQRCQGISRIGSPACGPLILGSRSHTAIGAMARSESKRQGAASGLGCLEIVEEALRREADEFADRNLSGDHPPGIVDALSD